MSTESGLSVYDKHYINGEWVSSSSQDSFCEVYDSNNGEPFAKIVKGTKEDVDRAIEAAHNAFPHWAELSVQRRKEYLQRLMEEYNKRKDDIAEALRRELGAPKLFAHKTQVEMMNMHLKAAIELADIFNWEEIVHNTWIVKEPIGVVACITPWNWPLNQIGCKIAPGLLAGNTIVLKPSEVTPICAHLFGEAVEAAQIPPGVLNIVFGQGAELGETMATHPKVDMVSFTGSTKVGSLLHKAGGETIKRVRTELGGKSAAILLDDATPEQIEMMSTQVLTNSGQTCDALSRLLVPKSRYDEVLQQVKEIYEKVKVIDATSDDDSCVEQGCKTIGPLSSKKQQDKVLSYIKKGLEEGAKILVGGDDKPEGMNENGYFVRPTVFYDVDNRMTIAQEEIFGPVLCIIPYSDVDEAIRIANDTIFGLNNAVAGEDIERAKKVARKLASGRVQVNTLEVNEHAPFGGYKQSGDGREWGKYGLEDFIQVKGVNLPSDQIRKNPENIGTSNLYKENRRNVDEQDENKLKERSQYNPEKESEDTSSGGMLQRLKQMAGFQSEECEQKPEENLKQEGQKKIDVESIDEQAEKQPPVETLKQKFEDSTQQSEEKDKSIMEHPLEGLKKKAKEKTGLQFEEGNKDEQQSVKDLKKIFEEDSGGQSSGKEKGEQHPLEDTKEKLKEKMDFQSRDKNDEENPTEDTKEELKKKAGLQSKSGKDDGHPLEDTKEKLKEKAGFQSEESDKKQQHPVAETLEKLKEKAGLEPEEGNKDEQHPFENIKEKIKEKTGLQPEEGEKSEEHPLKEMKEKFKEKSGLKETEEKGEEQTGKTLDEKIENIADQRVDEKLEKTVEEKADKEVEQKLNEKVEEKVSQKIEEKAKYTSEEPEIGSGKRSKETCDLKSEEECEQKCL